MHYVTAILLVFLIPGISRGQAAAPAAQPGPAYLALVNSAKTRIKEIDIVQLRNLQSSGTKFVLVDIREDSEWAAERLPGAMHIGKGVLERDIESRIPQKETMIVLYCHGGLRSALAAESIARMGYSNVSSLAGGLKAYQAANLPTEK